MARHAPEQSRRAATVSPPPHMPHVAMTAGDARLLDAIPDAVIVTDLAGAITSWNRGAERLYGWTASQAIGRAIVDVTPSDLSRADAAAIMVQLSRGEQWEGEFVVRRRDGTPFVARVTDTPLLDAHGTLIGIVGVSRDVSANDGGMRHLGFLAEASALLGASLDYARTVAEVARTLVPGLADVCTIFVEESGTLTRVAEAALDDDTERALRAIRAEPMAAALRPRLAEALASGRAVLVTDYLAVASTGGGHDTTDDTMRRIGVRSVIIAPLLVRGRSIGAIALGMVETSGRRFDAADARFAEELASRIGLAIDNSRLYGNAEAARLAIELRERTLLEERRIFETLYRIGTTLAKELDEQKLIELVTDEAASLTGASFGAFRSVFAGDGVIRCDDIRKEPKASEWGCSADLAAGAVSYLAVPVVTRSAEVLGGLFFAHPDTGRFTEEHERLVVGIAGQAAIALENARLYAQLRASEANARDAYAMAREAERKKDEFLAMLGHELRNPLAPIVTALELLRMRGETGREAEIIERQVGHVVRLVDDLLDVARITRGKIELKRQRLEISNVVARAIEIASPLIERRTHHLEIDVPATGLMVHGDPTRLAQIVSNLLANAAKYTDPGGHIRVRASRADDEVVISVRDDGTGIDADVLPGIFEPFMQSQQSLDRAQGGLGIGLTLVRSLVEMHGGRVTAESRGAGQGSEFVVHLPLAPETASSVALPPNSEPSVSGDAARALRVLVVDDNDDAAELMADALRVLGHVVETAADGPAALRLAASFRPDVAVLDIGLPVMDGYELAERLLESDRPPRRLVAVTGYGQAEDRARGALAGFDAHFVKPIDLAALRKTIAATPPSVKIAAHSGERR